MGNSLGDLVANATVAVRFSVRYLTFLGLSADKFCLLQRMGYPTMAIAACFGGPMLNILLGVGLSGTYLILFGPARGQPIHVAMGKTLLVSGVGLFAILVGTLVAVPLNGYRMSKRVGAALIAAWMVRQTSLLFLARNPCEELIPLFWSVPPVRDGHQRRRRDLGVKRRLVPFAFSYPIPQCRHSWCKASQEGRKMRICSLRMRSERERSEREGKS